MRRKLPNDRKAQPLNTDESRLLAWPIKNTSAVFASVLEYGGELNHLVSFRGLSSLGHGLDSSIKVSAVKAASDYLEYRLVNEKYSGKVQLAVRPFSGGRKRLIDLPPFHPTSSWAGHFDQDTAIINSYHKALERHILTVSYLKRGWKSFWKCSERIVADVTVTRLISNFTCDDIAAGMVVIQGPNFPGATFGYISANTETIENSKRWHHAELEAYSLYDRTTHKHLISKIDPTNPSINQLLNQKWIDPSFAPRAVRSNLPAVSPWLFSEDWSAKACIPFPYSMACVFGGGLVPSLSFPKISAAQTKYLRPILRLHMAQFREWSPVI